MIKFSLANLKAPLPAHWQPLVLAVENGAKLLLIRRNKDRFDVPAGQAWIALIGDDLYDAQGPAAFHTESLELVIKSACGAVIVSSGPEKIAYAAAAVPTIFGRNSVLIETRPEQEIPWLAFVQKANQNIQILVNTVKGGTA